MKFKTPKEVLEMTFQDFRLPYFRKKGPDSARYTRAENLFYLSVIFPTPRSSKDTSMRDVIESLREIGIEKHLLFKQMGTVSMLTIVEVLLEGGIKPCDIPEHEAWYREHCQSRKDAP